jgi:hypothetical protein
MIAGAAIVGGCHRESSARTVFEAHGSVAETLILAQLPQGDPSVKLKHVADTNLYAIVVTGSNPQAAADRANALTKKVQLALNSQSAVKPSTVWKKVEPNITQAGQ